MASKIYTKTGDKGTTSLIGGTKVPKSHVRIDAYGTIDELNSYIGLCRDLLQDEQSRKILLEIQDRLFTIGAALACDPVKEPKMRMPDLKETDVILLENEMDRMNESVEPMKFFILPGGHPVLSHLHIARCICRRAERCCVRLQLELGDALEPVIIQYVNRLSDYLFVLVRYTGHLLQVAEIPWKPRTA
ncbi:MAG: cob(I)yrinic acid a,c-diamide adenosyltransferase [Chitinophagaceae bacterium]